MLITVDRNILEGLSHTEQEIVRFINENEERLTTMSIVDIAEETYSSPASVSRAIRKCGISGFHELRYKLTAAAKQPEICRMGEVVNNSLLEVQRVIDELSVPTVLSIVESIRTAERIVVLGRGLTEYVAEEFCLKLQLLDHNALVIRDPNIMRTRTAKMRANELLFIFSLGGQTPELIESAQNASLRGAKIITCCCDVSSPLIPLSDHVVVGHRERRQEIAGYEVDSRLPLHLLSRIVVDYLVS